MVSATLSLNAIEGRPRIRRLLRASHVSKILPFLMAVRALAQITAGQISGYIVDPASRPVPHAEVTVINTEYGFQRSARADNTGFYCMAALPPALYRVVASAPGFSAALATDLRVNVGSQLRVDLALSLPERRESVEVRPRVELVPDTAEMALVLDQPRIEMLPLNRRDFLQLALLAPGVSPPVENSALSSRGGFAMHASGGREEYNNFLLDGADNNDQYENTYVLQPSVDSIQEFKILTNNYSAEYGRNAAGQVNIITRSGGNYWHGSAYEYARNRDLDARNFFDGTNKPEYIRNQFGTGAGGPVWKNRSFLFANFDSLRERDAVTELGTVPTLAQRASIPAGVSPLVLKILDLFPLPNRPGDTGNYLGQPVAHENTSQYNVRFDQQITDHDQLSLRYSYANQHLFEPYAQGSTDVLPGFGDYVTNIGHNAMVHYQKALGSRTFNSLRIGFNRSFRQALPQNYQTDVGKLWNVSWLNIPTRDFGYPQINVAGFSPLGDQTALPIARSTDTFQAVDGVSLVRGAHTLKLGAEVRNVRFDASLDYYARGSLTFASGMAGLLAGTPSFGLQAQFDNPQTLRTTAYNAYMQDDWKVTPHLTLNLGLRYEFNSPPADPHNRMSVYDPVIGQIVQVGTHGVPRAGIQPDYDNFAPRVGFAWSPARNWVLRGGYGIYYEAGMLEVNSSLYFNPPYFNLHLFLPQSLGNPFPLSGAITQAPTPNTLSPDLSTGYVQQWSFNIERQLGGSTVASVAYSGSKGTHLIRARDLNQPLPGPGDIQDRRPLPAFGGIFFIESGANSHYDALQVLIDRRLARRVSLLGAYTFSKSIDDASSFLGTAEDINFPQNSHDIRAERALSSFDTRQRFTAAWVYVAPYHVEIRGITTAESGQPFTPYLQFDNSNTGNIGGVFGLDRPDLLYNPSLANPGPQAWFDISAFAIPAKYHFGSAGRNILTGPGLFSFDLAASRRFVLREGVSLSLDVEAFNLFNHVNFDLPEAYADEPGTFGKIFSAKAPRQVQLALRFAF